MVYYVQVSYNMIGRDQNTLGNIIFILIKKTIKQNMQNLELLTKINIRIISLFV